MGAIDLTDRKPDAEKPHPQMGQRPSREVLALSEGDRIELLDGTVREVTSNPRDGVWILGRLAGSSDDELIAISEIQRIQPRTRGP